MSDPVDEAYQRFILAQEVPKEPEVQVNCPKCESTNVDMGAGYRGEYQCLDCGHRWQVGGGNAT